MQTKNLIFFTIFGVLFAVTPVLGKTAPVAKKTAVAPVKKVTVAKKTTAVTTVKKAATATTTKVATEVKVEIAAADSVVPTMTCMQAIKKANAYCLSVAKGCNSESTLPRCLEANAKCEVQQKAALALCPSTNQ